MSLVSRIPNLGGARVLVLHRPHTTIATLARQLSAIGLVTTDHWPELPADAVAADFIFFDVDLGFDQQFPWRAGGAPMPTIALIGSEAPGRIEWALSRKADAQMLKPIGQAGAYTALLTARQTFEERMRQGAEIAALQTRVAQRQTIVRAVALLVSNGCDETKAFEQLRQLAMSWQISMESAAQRVVAMASSGEMDDHSNRA